mmetsp:Transcript_1329/g.2896  ORF Transcript_1329/g.2896 Transcript_1329/m.2896 type:complete len:206 (-) Transcript_1329:715-1332(-)
MLRRKSCEAGFCLVNRSRRRTMSGKVCGVAISLSSHSATDRSDASLSSTNSNTFWWRSGKRASTCFLCRLVLVLSSLLPAACSGCSSPAVPLTASAPIAGLTDGDACARTSDSRVKPRYRRFLSTESTKFLSLSMAVLTSCMSLGMTRRMSRMASYSTDLALVCVRMRVSGSSSLGGRRGSSGQRSWKSLSILMMSQLLVVLVRM